MHNPRMKTILMAVLFCAAVASPILAADREDPASAKKQAPTTTEAVASKPLPEERPIDPELKAKLDAVKSAEDRAYAMVPRLQEGSDLHRAQAKTEARKILAELFDAKVALQELQLGRMEKQAADLKAKIAHKKLSREKAIDERLAKMGGQDDWE